MGYMKQVMETEHDFYDVVGAAFTLSLPAGTASASRTRTPSWA